VRRRPKPVVEARSASNEHVPPARGSDIFVDVAGALRETPRGRQQAGWVAFRRFRRARHQLWAVCALLVLGGALLHEWATQSFSVRLAWLMLVAALVGLPLYRLLGFRCPRCGLTFLATGRWHDFLGVGRIFWSRRCGNCALPIAEEGPPSSGPFPESRPV
jgi:hypothetical protein